MLGKLFLLFTAVTLIEIGLLIKLGNLMGVWWTLVLIFGTGFLGAWLARNEGVRVLNRIRKELEAGRVPADAALDGGFVLLAGALLITPGVITDLAGFASLVARLRAPVKRWLRARFRRWIEEGKIQVTTEHPFGPRDPRQGDVIDVTAEPDED